MLLNSFQSHEKSRCSAACWGEPFTTFLNGREKAPITDFWDKMPENWDPTVSSNFRARNYQSFELGLDHLNDNDDYIQDSLPKSLVKERRRAIKNLKILFGAL